MYTILFIAILYKDMDMLLGDKKNYLVEEIKNYVRVSQMDREESRYIMIRQI